MPGCVLLCGLDLPVDCLDVFSGLGYAVVCSDAQDEEDGDVCDEDEEEGEDGSSDLRADGDESAEEDDDESSTLCRCDEDEDDADDAEESTGKHRFGGSCSKRHSSRSRSGGVYDCIFGLLSRLHFLSE